MSLIEKIDKRIEHWQLLAAEADNNGQLILMNLFDAKEQEARAIKQLILSEQKEPCRFCKDIKGIKYQKMAGNLLDGTTITIVGDTKCDYCPICGRPLNQSVTDNNVVTIGDKIRESNESLAEFIKTVTDKCITGSCRTCPIYKACDQMENKEDLARYFSQPYTE